MTTPTTYPQGTLTLHLTPARLTLLINSAQLLMVLAPHNPLASVLIWSAIGALWIARLVGTAKQTQEKPQFEPRAGVDEELKITDDQAEAEALLAEKEGGPAALATGGAAFDETKTHVAGIVVGTVTLVAAVCKGYLMWRDW